MRVNVTKMRHVRQYSLSVAPLQRPASVQVPCSETRVQTPAKTVSLDALE